MAGGMGFALGGAFGLFMASVSHGSDFLSPFACNGSILLRAEY